MRHFWFMMLKILIRIINILIFIVLPGFSGGDMTRSEFEGVWNTFYRAIEWEFGFYWQFWRVLNSNLASIARKAVQRRLDSST